MSLNGEKAFTEFIQFCTPYLKEAKATEILKLLRKRFNDCKDEFKNSAEFLDLIDITIAKIESDRHNIFIHIRDFHNVLKLKKIDKKRKRDSEEGSTNCEVSVKVPKIHVEPNTGPIHKNAISDKKGVSESSKILDDDDCIMIGDSDDDVEELCPLSTKISQYCTIGLHNQLPNNAKQSVLSFDINNTKEISPKIKDSGRCKLSLNKNLKPQESSVKVNENIFQIHLSCSSLYSSKSEKSFFANNEKSLSKGGELQLKQPLKSKNESQAARSTIVIEEPIILDDDSNEADGEASGCLDKQKENGDNVLTENNKKKICSMVSTSSKNVTKNQTGNVNKVSGDALKDVEKTVLNNEKENNALMSKTKGRVKFVEIIDLNSDKNIPEIIDEVELEDEAPKVESPLPDEVKDSGCLMNIPESRVELSKGRALESDDSVSDIGNKVVNDRTSSLAKIAQNPNSSNSNVKKRIEFSVAADLERNEKVSSTGTMNEVVDKAEEENSNSRTFEESLAIAFETDIAEAEKEIGLGHERAADQDKRCDKPDAEKVECDSTASDASPDKKIVQKGDKKEKTCSDDAVDISQNEKCGTSSDMDTADDEKENCTDRTMENTEAGIKMENTETKENSTENTELTTRNDKAKTGSKKQIKRLEKLLEDLRNKIEELQEKEVGLDELDDDCSTYILQDKYERKFVKVWDKLCELQQMSNSSGRPVDKKFMYTGTRYPEINRKLVKFVNKRKIFPDYHDVMAVIVKVNHDKKIGLRTHDIERLAREAFVDIGSNLQERRKKDLACTSAGHLKITEKLPEDPALHDPELRKKLLNNKKIYREKMNKVLSKYSEMADSVEEVEGEESGDTDDDEDEILQDPIEEVPELTTILEGRGSPELENLDIKAKEKQICLTNENLGEEMESFVIETDNAESSSSKEVTTDTSLLTSEITSGDERTFLQKGKFKYSEMGNEMHGSETDISIVTSEETSGDEKRLMKEENCNYNDGDIQILGNESDSSLSTTDMTSGDERIFKKGKKDSNLNENNEGQKSETRSSLLSVVEKTVNKEFNPSCSTQTGFSTKDKNMNSCRKSQSLSQCLVDPGSLVDISELDQKHQSTECTEESKHVEVGNSNEDCPKLYVAVKCDETTPQILKNEASPNKVTRHQLSGDDDLFQSSENDNSSPSRSNSPILDIIKTLESDSHENSLGAHDNPLGSRTKETFSDGLNETSENHDKKEKPNKPLFGKLCTKFLSEPTKSRVKNLLHLKKNDATSDKSNDHVTSEVYSEEDLDKSVVVSDQIDDTNSTNSPNSSISSHSNDVLVKKIKLTPDIRKRACKLLSSKSKQKRTGFLNIDTENESSLDSCGTKTHLDDVLVDSLSSSPSSNKKGQMSTCKVIKKSRSSSPLLNSPVSCSLDSCGTKTHLDDVLVDSLSSSPSSNKKGQMSTCKVIKKSRSSSPLLNSPVSCSRDSEDIMLVSLGNSENTISTMKEGSQEREINQSEESQRGEVIKSDSRREIQRQDSKSSSKSSRSSPFLKIVDVTTIDLEEYNSDNAESTPKKKSPEVIECLVSPDEETKLKTSSKFSKQFGKMNKISNFLSCGNSSKKENSRKKDKSKNTGLINIDEDMEDDDVIVLSDSD